MISELKFDWARFLPGSFGLLGIVVTLLILQMMPVHDDEFGRNVRDYYPGACHICLLLTSSVGVIASIIAVRKRSWWWLIAMAGNALLFASEYISGGYS
jgi:hypothetical protein